MNGGKAASFAQHHTHTLLVPPQPQTFSPPQFPPSQNLPPTPANRAAYAHTSGASAVYGYPIRASLQDANAVARVSHEERVRMLLEPDFHVPAADIYHRDEGLGQESQYSSRATSPVSPMMAPQPIRGVSQQLLQEHISPLISQTPIPMARTVPPAVCMPQARPTATRLPPLDLARRNLRDSKIAHLYMNRPHWRPLTKSHGVPETEEDRLPYVKKIYDALIDTDKVFDDHLFPTDRGRFQAGYGVWGTDPACIEAVAHEVVEICMNLHDKGATGIALGRFPALKQLHEADKKFTFPQRIHFMALLLRHFKFHASHVMQSNLTMQYAARIWSTLSELPGFLARWNQMSLDMRKYQLHLAPYIDMPAKVMILEEGNQYVREDTLEQEQKIRRITMQQLQRQQEMARQQGQPIPNARAMKREFDQVQGHAVDMANKHRHVESQSDHLAPTQQQPDLVVQEELTEGEDAFLVKKDDEQADTEALFSDGSTSPQKTASPQPNFDDIFDAGDSDDEDSKAPVQTQVQDEGADGETVGEMEDQG
jgi:hypothetical protein